MTRPFRLSAPCLAILALAACATGPDPAVAPPAPGQSAPRAAAPTPALAPPRPGEIYTAPAPSQAVRDQAALAAGCRSDADRIVTTRDRGQLMREDERDARVGTQGSIYAQRGETDRLGRIFERDRIAADCVQQNTRSTPQR